MLIIICLVIVCYFIDPTTLKLTSDLREFLFDDIKVENKSKPKSRRKISSKSVDNKKNTYKDSYKPLDNSDFSYNGYEEEDSDIDEDVIKSLNKIHRR